MMRKNKMRSNALRRFLLSRRTVRYILVFCCLLSLHQYGYLYLKSQALFVKRRNFLDDAPLPRHDAQNQTMQSNNSYSNFTQNAINVCNCPKTCQFEALNQVRNGNKVTCLDRILRLSGKHQIQPQAACHMASYELDSACGSACNPNYCLGKIGIDKRQENKIVFVIASLPKDARHVVALWSQLECLAKYDNNQKRVDLILLSVPETYKSIVEPLVAKARSALNLDNVLHVHYNANNDRYDVGLWCNALMDRTSIDNKTSIVLSNDSVFVMRQFSDIHDIIHKNETLDLVGLSYSNHGSYWVESVVRGFSSRGVEKFMQHSCQAPGHRFCRHREFIDKRKRCIVENFEIDLVTSFSPENVLGLYPSEPPDNTDRNVTHKTWVVNLDFWRDVLVNQWNFPLAKVNHPDMVPTLTHDRLQACTKRMDLGFIRGLNYSVTP